MIDSRGTVHFNQEFFLLFHVIRTCLHKELDDSNMIKITKQYSLNTAVMPIMRLFG